MLFFRSVPGLAHRIDKDATQAAIDWLDETAQVLKTPKDYYEYGMKLFEAGQPGRAYWALKKIKEEESGWKRLPGEGRADSLRRIREGPILD
jgi:hypothetical protein